MANTYTLIASSTVGSGGAANIEFTSIPATYTDLLIKISARQGADNAFDLTFNDSTTSYSTLRLQGDGSAVASNNAGGVTSAIRSIGIENTNNTANTFGNTEVYIPNYASSNYKSVNVDGVNESNGTEIYMNLLAGLWSNTSAINKIKIAANAGSLVEYSSAYLYGIKNS